MVLEGPLAQVLPLGASMKGKKRDKHEGAGIGLQKRI